MAETDMTCRISQRGSGEAVCRAGASSNKRVDKNTMLEAEQAPDHSAPGGEDPKDE